MTELALRAPNLRDASRRSFGTNATDPPSPGASACGATDAYGGRVP